MRNKKLADNILIVLLISFIIITLFRIFISNGFTVKLISFIIEAALVGGVADWFAVTALFREPLGFSWHTAIIPKNKEKVVDAITNVVESELLSPETIKNKVEQLDIVDILIPYIEKSNIKTNLVDLLGKHGKELINKLDTEKIAGYTEGLIKSKLRDIDLHENIKGVLDWSAKNGVYDRTLETLLNELIKVIETDSARETISNIINSEVRNTINAATGLKRVFLEISLGLAEGTNSINVSEAAASLQKELVETLTEAKDKENELYIRLREIFEDFVQRVKTDESLSSSIEVWKQDVISQAHFQDEIQTLINEAKENVGNNVKLYQWIAEQADKYWNNFKQDAKRKAWVNNNIKVILNKIVDSEHHLIGAIVKDTLSSFTDEALNQFIESKAGNDLHWIRINGSILGAVAGLIIFLFINLFYEPFAVPVIREWVSFIVF